MRYVALLFACLIALSATSGASSLARPQIGQTVVNYKLSGAATLRPSRIWDDGARTYIVWPAEVELPAVFSLGPDGREVLTDGAMREGNFVLDRVHSVLVFRIDRSVATAKRKGIRRE